MALVQYGAIITSMAGKLGGHVLERNRKGNFIRTNAIPRLNSTSRGYSLRNNMSIGANAWHNLSESARLAWATEATTYTFYTKYNVAYTPNGYQLYTYVNLLFAAAGLTMTGTAPTHASIAGFSVTPSNMLMSAQILNVTFSVAPSTPYYILYWITYPSLSGNEMTGKQFIYCSKIQSSSVGPHNIFFDVLTTLGNKAVVGSSFIIKFQMIKTTAFAKSPIVSYTLNIVT